MSFLELFVWPSSRQLLLLGVLLLNTSYGSFVCSVVLVRLFCLVVLLCSKYLYLWFCSFQHFIGLFCLLSASLEGCSEVLFYPGSDCSLYRFTWGSLFISLYIVLLTLPSCLRAFSQGCCHPAPLFLFLALQRAFLSSEVCFFSFFYLVPSSYPSGSVDGSVLSSIFNGSYLFLWAHLHIVGMLLFLSFDINQLILPSPF